MPNYQHKKVAESDSKEKLPEQFIERETSKTSSKQFFIGLSYRFYPTPISFL